MLSPVPPSSSLQVCVCLDGFTSSLSLINAWVNKHTTTVRRSPTPVPTHVNAHLFDGALGLGQQPACAAKRQLVGRAGM